MKNSSFEQTDYDQAEKAFSLWQAKQDAQIDEYIMRQRQADLNKLVRKVIKNELNEQEKLIVKLCWYNGMTKEQAAEYIGISRSTIFRRLERITDKLYEKLKYAIEYRYGSESLKASPVLIKKCADVPSEAVKNIGERLRFIRKNQYLTLEEVGKETNIKAERLGEIENGAALNILELKKLALFYKVKTDYLLFGSHRVLRNPYTGLPVDYNCERTDDFADI